MDFFLAWLLILRAQHARKIQGFRKMASMLSLKFVLFYGKSRKIQGILMGWVDTTCPLDVLAFALLVQTSTSFF